MFTRFGLVEGFSDTRLAPVAPRFNIAPTQDVLGITQAAGRRTLKTFRWGLVPSWAKDGKTSKPLINAKYETIAEKPSFKNAFKRRRCLIPADGFFEWQQEPGVKLKRPVYFQRQDQGLFAFAGIWERWQSATGEALESCAIITVPANELIAPVHDRMPAILLQANEQEWLDESASMESVYQLLGPYPSDLMMANEVSLLVNSPKNDTEDCVRRLNRPA